MKKILTLVVVVRNQQILLGMKKRGFGEGRWNGFGGKVQEGESIEDAARRELFEETGCIAGILIRRGKLMFEFQNDPERLEVHLFAANEIKGEPEETDEMAPRWFLIEEIPYDSMWPDDRYWLPLFLEGKSIDGTFLFKDKDTILSMNIREIEHFSIGTRGPGAGTGGHRSH